MEISSMLSSDNGNDDAQDKRSALLNSIDSANLDRVRKVLKEICAEDIAAFELACAKLLVPDDSHSNETSVKRKRQPDQRFETCMQCKAEYDTTNNPPDLCRWHPGRTEPDHDGDFWADHDEDCHGIIDSDFCREEYPEGFKWTCCGELGDVQGCQVDVHRPQTAKKAKVMTHGLNRSRAPTAQSNLQQYVAVPPSARKNPRLDDATELQKHCIQCGNMYDIAENTETSCKWHTGELEPLYESEVWADHDERIHGRIDTEEHKKEFPRGFEWDCCQRRGDEVGCEVDVHRFEI